MPNAPWVICRWHITEDEVKTAFVTAFNKLVTERADANVASRSCASTSASCASEEIAANDNHLIIATNEIDISLLHLPSV